MNTARGAAVTKLVGRAIAILAALAPVAGRAADFSDPTWPCIQRKVEDLSIGLMWPHPIPGDAADAALAAEIEALAELLVLRRTEVGDLGPEVAAFAAAHGGDPAALGRLFARAFTSLAQRRTRIMDGIADFSLGQIALAGQIDSRRLELDRLTDAAEPDFDEIDRLEEQLDWDEVIFTDRQKSITYLCETPQLIEKRLYAIAQLLAAEVK
jgi:hypothetical protein